jgi:MFS family permease
MDPVLARIDAWEQDGLLDPLIAARLRAAESSRPVSALDDATVATPGPDTLPAPMARPAYLAVSSVFGPGVSIGEMFGYLGAAFIGGAWTAFVARLAGSELNTTTIGGGALIAAAGLIVVALALGRVEPRRRRAAGVALLVAVLYVGAAVGTFVSQVNVDAVLLVIIVTGATMGTAAAFRLLLPGLLMTLGLIASITTFGWAILTYLESLVVSRVDLGFGNSPPPSGLPLVAIAGISWLLVALVLGLLAVAEDRAAARRAAGPDDHDAARRRSTLIRAWAGLVAVWGLASAVTQSWYTDSFEFQRVIPTWLGDAAILLLAIVLVERAFRRDSGAFLVAAGIGFVTALTDFNFTYVSESRDIGLLLEGGILLGVGFIADRLRRRMSGGRSTPPPAAPPATIGEPGPA